jgi:outer membrane protein assembly factor BamB
MVMVPNVYHSKQDLIISALKNGSIIALDAKTGQQRWIVNLTKEFRSSAVLLPIEGVKEFLVGAISSDGTFYLVNGETGVLYFTYKLDQTSRCAPVIKDNVLYLASLHKLVALKIE